MTKPATVSYGPSGSSIPVSSAKSSRLSRPSTSRSPPPAGAGGLLVHVVLVADVADELLDQVLERDDAVGAAVLVDDDRQVVPGAAHLATGRRARACCRAAAATSRASSPTRGAAGRRRRGRTGRGRARSRPRRRRAADDRVAASAAGRRRLATALLHRHRRVEEVDLGARAPSPRAAAARRPRRRRRSAARSSRPQRLVRGDEAAQLLVADLLAAGVGVTAEQADDEVRRLRQQPDDRAARRAAKRSTIGAATSARPSARCSASRLGASSPSTSEKYEMIKVMTISAVASDMPFGRPQLDQRGRELVRQRGRPEGRRQEAGERDPDLHRGEEPVGVAGDSSATRAPAPAAPGERAAAGSRAATPAPSRWRRRARPPARRPGPRRSWPTCYPSGQRIGRCARQNPTRPTRIHVRYC